MTTDSPPAGTGMNGEGVPSPLQVFADSVRVGGTAEVSVRTLLGWFGARRRGSRVVSRVAEALRQVGLGTGGALHTAGIDDTLRFYGDGREPELISAGVVGEGPDRARTYPAGWLEGTATYGDSLQRPVRKPSDIGTIVAAARRLTPDESEGIAERIRRHKVIPLLSFFPLRRGMEATWWFHPLIIVAEQFGSWVAVDKNGVYLAARGHQDCDLGIAFDKVCAHALEQVESRLWRLTLEYAEGGFVTLDEFVPSGAGPYLRILDAILEVYAPVIEASQGYPMWFHGAGGEGYQTFASWEELLQDDGKWEAVPCADPSVYGMPGGRAEVETADSDGEEGGDEEAETDDDDHDETVEVGWHTDGIRGFLEHASVLISWGPDGTVRQTVRPCGPTYLLYQGPQGEIWGGRALRNGDLCFWGQDGMLAVVDGDDADCTTLEGHLDTVWGVAELPDGSIVSGSGDGTVRRWDPEAGMLLETFEGHAGAVGDVQALPDGRFVSVSLDATIRLWVPGQTSASAVIQGGVPFTKCRVLGPETLLAWGPGGVGLWSLATGASLARFDDPAVGVLSSSVTVAPEGFVVAGKDSRLRLWDPSTSTLVRELDGHDSGEVMGCVLLPDGSVLSYGDDGVLHVWDLSTGERLRTMVGHTDWITDAGLLSDGTLASCSFDRTIRRWDWRTGEELEVIGTPRQSRVILVPGASGEARPSDDSIIEAFLASMGSGAHAIGDEADDEVGDQEAEP